MSDHRRTTTKGVRFDEVSRSGSSRASTTGGSSASSGSQYTLEYNNGALQSTLQKTVQEMDAWKARVLEAEVEIGRLRKTEEEHKARIKALEHANKRLQTENNDIEKDNQSLRIELASVRKENSGLRKAVSPPSSPDSGKLHRSDSKKKDPDTDKHNERLKERFNRSPESSRPPTSLKSGHRSSGRRTSISSNSPSTERPYIEPWGSCSPISPTSSRRPEYFIPPPMPPVTSAHQAPVYANTPRTTGMQRPTVEMEYSAYSGSLYPIETGNYQFHPLPRSRP